MIRIETVNAWQVEARDHHAALQVPGHYIPLIAEKITPSSECWIWTASRKQNGYAQYNTGGRNWNAHRLVYLLAGGQLGSDEELDHICGVRHCVNPRHLEPVTHLVNVQRASAKVTACPRGHRYTPENTYTWRGCRSCRTCRRARNSRRSRRENA